MKNFGFALTLLLSTTSLAIPNPASVNCIELGGQLQIRQTYSGAQYGVCRFGTEQDGSECEEWALFNGECKRGDCSLWGADDNADGSINSFCRIGR